jgi:Holliday junction resolvase
MGKPSRSKGLRFEREIVHLLQDAGRAAERVPLSGAAGGSFCGDVTAPVLGDDWIVECKSRARDFTRIYSWLDGADALVIKADRRRPLVVLDLRRALKILSAIEGSRA